MRLVWAVAILTGLSGCVGSTSNETTIAVDTSFLRELIEYPQYSSWEKHHDELLYLVSKGDKRAAAASIKVIPILLRSDVANDIEISCLVTKLFENNDVSINDISALSPDDQAAFIYLCDAIQPLDWGGDARAAYLGKHPKVATILETKFPKDEGSVESSPARAPKE